MSRTMKIRTFRGIVSMSKDIVFVSKPKKLMEAIREDYESRVFVDTLFPRSPIYKVQIALAEYPVENGLWKRIF